jgi:hypothetical protein
MNRLKLAGIALAIGAATALTASAQSVATSINESPGHYSRDTTVTGVNGRSATYTDNKNWGDGAYTNTRSYTGVNGGTRTDTVARSGGVVTKTVTGRNGNSRSYSRPAHYRR